VSCRGHRHRALIARGLCERNLAVATLWPSPTSSTLGGRRFRAKKSGGDQAVAVMGPLERWKGQTKLAQGTVRWSRWKGQTKLAQGTVRWSRWKGQTRLAHDMVRWTDGKVKPSWRCAGSIGADGRVKPSWRRASSVGPMERSNKAGGGLARWIDGKVKTKLADGMIRWTDGKGSDGPLPGFGWWSGALTLAGSREFKGRPRDNKTIGSVQSKLPFPRSIDKGSTGACGAHQATAPSTQLVGCDGDWPAYRV
jgi:hypothetical protein